MPIDHNLPHDLDEQYGPGAEDADTEAGTLEELESLITEELYVLIRDAKGCIAIEECQPPKSIVEAMAKAAAQVLIAFERGYRMS